MKKIGERPLSKKKGSSKVNIKVREENARLPVSEVILERLSACAFDLTGKRPGEISLVVCDDDFIAVLNERYRKRSETTDVLSFSMREGEFSEVENSVLGDIIISVETARQQAREFNTTLEGEFLILFTHGLLHLLGYTHDDAYNERIMTRFTQEILRRVRKSS